MPELSAIVIVTISGAFVFGMVVVLLGSVRPLLAKRLGLSEMRVEWLLSALNLSLIPMMLFSGILIDEFGVKTVFIAGSLFTAAGIFSLAASNTVLQAVGAVLLAGAGGACLSTGSIVLMPRAFYPEHAAASLNMGNVFFALGALLTPMVAERLFTRLGYRRALSVLALVCLLPTLAAVFTSRGAFPPAEHEAHALAAVLRHPLVWLAGLVLFLYVPLEGSLASWADRYLSALGFGARQAAWLVSGFWLSFLAARLLAAIIEQRGLMASTNGQGVFIVVLAMAAAVTLGNLAGATKGISAACGLLLMGALLGPIFPTLVGVLFDSENLGTRGTAYGAMFAIGALGNLFLPQMIGAYAQRSTVQRSMRIDMILALVMALAALFLALFPLIG